MQFISFIGRKTVWLVCAVLIVALSVISFSKAQDPPAQDPPITAEDFVSGKTPEAASESLKNSRKSADAKDDSKSTEPISITPEDHFRSWQYLKNNQVSFEAVVPLPFLVDDLSIEKYIFEVPERRLRLLGGFAEDKKSEEKKSEEDVFSATIEKLAGAFPEISFAHTENGYNFFLDLNFPKNPDADIAFLRGKPGSLSELQRHQLENAIPFEKDSGLLKNVIHPLLEQNRLSLKNASFQSVPQEPEESDIKMLPFAVTAEGFIKDMFAFVSDVQKQSRLFTVQNFEFTVTDVRDSVAIGRMRAALAAYYR